MTIKELTSAYRSGSFTPSEHIKTLLKKIDETSDYRYFVYVAANEALRSAEEADARYKEGRPLSAVDGIPYGLKDLVFTKDMPTTLGSAAWQGYMAPEDAEIVRILKDAGAVCMGKLNMQERAFGAAGDVSYIGYAKNPYDKSKVCGGSSSGSAGAVALGLLSFSISTDTGGSGRIPASICGVMGMKPTHGRISIRGVYPVCEELDHVGIMSSCAEDNAAVLSVLAGYDPKDPFCRDVPADADYGSKIGEDIRGLKACVPRKYFSGCCQEGVLTLYGECEKRLKSLGLDITDIDLPADFDTYRPLHQALLLGNAYANNEEEIKSHPELIGEGLIGRFLSGDQPVSKYINALHTREKFRNIWRDLMKNFDVMILPALPAVAVEPFAPGVIINGKLESTAPAYTHFLWFSDYSGFPSMSVPMGLSEGLPAGFQIIAKEWGEATVYKVAHVLELFCGEDK